MFLTQRSNHANRDVIFCVKIPQFQIIISRSVDCYLLLLQVLCELLLQVLNILNFYSRVCFVNTTKKYKFMF